MKLSFLALPLIFLASCGSDGSDNVAGVVITTNTIATGQGDIVVKYDRLKTDTAQLYGTLREVVALSAPPAWDPAIRPGLSWNVWNWSSYDTLQFSESNPSAVMTAKGGAWASVVGGVYALDSTSRLRIPAQSLGLVQNVHLVMQVYLTDTLRLGSGSMLVQKGNLQSPDSKSWGLSLESSGQLQLKLKSGSAQVVLKTTQSIPLHRWLQLELKISPNSASILLDQQALAISSWTESVDVGNDQDLRIALDSVDLPGVGKKEVCTLRGLLDYIALRVQVPGSSSSSSVSPSSSSQLGSSSSTAVLGTLTDGRDGKVYQTTQIGSQIWMAQNLNYSTSSGSYCYWNDANQCTTFGRLYTWNAAMNGKGGQPLPVQGICPVGWHLPSAAEWETLALSLGDSTRAGVMLKGDYANADWSSAVFHGVNASGFGALPGGFKDDIPPSNLDNGVYKSIGTAAYFWSASELSSTQVQARGLYALDSSLGLETVNKTYSLAVRCVKD